MACSCRPYAMRTDITVDTHTPGRRLTPRLLSIGQLYFAVIAMPPAVFYLGLSTSNALGMVLLAFMLLLIRPCPAHAAVGMRPVPARQRHNVTAAVLLAIVLHLAVASALGPIDAVRAVASLLPLALLVLGGAALANAMLSASAERLHGGVVHSYVVLCVLALIGATGWGPPTIASEPWRAPVFPFSEPSAFALAFVPTMMYACVSTRGTTRWWFLIAGVLCSALIQNLTTIAGVLLVALVTLRLPVLLALSVPIGLALSQVNLTYYAERLDFSGDVQNLSNLVYVQGWQMIEESLTRSGGFGLGFQQLGVRGTDVPAAELLRTIGGGEDKNLLDGGFAFAKLGSDFGVFGIVLAVLYLLLAVRSVLVLRQVTHGRRAIPPALVLAHCAVVAWLIELFVRSSGYFTGTALLLSSALWVLSRSRGARKARHRSRIR